MEKIDRNNRIIALKRQGISVPAISAEVRLSASAIRYILEKQEDQFHEFPIPGGNSLRAARAVSNAISLWPTQEALKRLRLAVGPAAERWSPTPGLKRR